MLGLWEGTNRSTTILATLRSHWGFSCANRSNSSRGRRSSSLSLTARTVAVRRWPVSIPISPNTWPREDLAAWILFAHRLQPPVDHDVERSGGIALADADLAGLEVDGPAARQGELEVLLRELREHRDRREQPPEIPIALVHESSGHLLRFPRPSRVRGPSTDAGSEPVDRRFQPWASHATRACVRRRLRSARARMAESADAEASKAFARKGVGVQVPLRAPREFPARTRFPSWRDA